MLAAQFFAVSRNRDFGANVRYPTGNPFKLHERFTMLVRAAPTKLTNVQMRGSPTLTEISRVLGTGPALTARSRLPWGLPETAIPQQRWVAAPWTLAKEAVLDLLKPGAEIGLAAAPQLKRAHGRFIYLNAAEGLSEWVKVGKAEKCFTERLWKQQLCNPRALGHLGVWRVPDQAVLHAEERHARGLLENAGAAAGAGGREWRRMQWPRALEILTAAAPQRGWQLVAAVGSGD